MLQLISSLGIFIFIIFLGWFCKQIHLFKKEDAMLFGRLSLNVTLPAALLANADRVVLNLDSLMLIATGIIANLVLLFLGWMVAGKKDPIRQAGMMLNCGGYNIGNFSFPFVSLMYGPAGIASLMLIDSGSAVICLGFSYVIAYMVAHPGEKVSFAFSMKKLFSSVPFDVYMLLLVMAAFHIKLPALAAEAAGVIGNANSFVALFMVGLLLDFNMPKEEFQDAFKVLGVRLFGNLALGLLLVMILPLPDLAKRILLIALLSPVPSVVPIYAHMLGYDRPLTAVTSTMSAIMSIVLFAIISLF